VEFISKNEELKTQEITSTMDRLSQVAVGSLRPADVLLRYGAQSLVIIFPNTTDRSAEALERRIMKALSGDMHDATSFRLRTAVATTPPDGPSIAGLLEVASNQLVASSRTQLDGDATGLIH
jgi:GGDEF domain-containing protein